MNSQGIWPAFQLWHTEHLYRWKYELLLMLVLPRKPDWLLMEKTSLLPPVSRILVPAGQGAGTSPSGIKLAAMFPNPKDIWHHAD